MSTDTKSHPLPAGWCVGKALEATKIRISEWNGHMRSGSYWYSDRWYDAAEVREAELLRSCRLGYTAAEEEKAEKLLSALDSGVPLDEFVVIGTPTRQFVCRFCDKTLKLETNGVTLRVSGEPCPYPEGIAHIDTELNVPSGRIVVSDDLRAWYRSDHKETDLNRLSGLIETTLAYSEINMATGYVGSSDPGVYSKRGVITIGSKERTRKDKTELLPSSDWGRKVAVVRTNLWWYSLADLGDFAQRLKNYTPDLTEEEWLKGYGNSVITAKPGVYRVRWFTEAQHTDKGVRHAELTWIRPPNLKVDHLARERTIRLTALECCIQSAIDWPTLYLPVRDEDGDYDDRLSWEELNDEQKLYAIARSADHLMCVLGGGVEWHENGHVLMRVSEKAKEFAALMSPDGVVPLFDEKQHWYPFSEEYGGLCLGAGLTNAHGTDKEINLNPTFVSLALNIARNYIKYPPKPDLNLYAWPPVYVIKDVRNRMKLALRVYRETRKKYQVEPLDAEFDAIAMSADYDSVIETYDLGPTHPPEREWGPPPQVLSFEKFAFVEFDAEKVKAESYYCWHPRNPGCAGCWAKPADGQRYAIASGSEEQGFYSSADKSVPLKFVARVIKLIHVNSGPVLEIAFDYGDSKMTGDAARRWALTEAQIKGARGFDDAEEYASLLPTMTKVFDDMEQLIEAKHKEIFG